MTGSVQLRTYVQARRNGHGLSKACEISGLSAEEARLTDIANERGEIELAPWPHDHNQTEEKTVAEETVAADELRLLIERAERLEGEKKAIADDIKDVMLEAKARGYDTKAIKKIIAIRKKREGEFQEEEAILQTYMSALGMQLSFL